MELSQLYYPSLKNVKTALFIQPHPDDNEIGAGGTMALLRRQGTDVYGLTVTEGRGGSDDPNITPEMLGDIRKEEAHEAMKRLDVIDLGNLGYHDQNPIVPEKLVEDIVRVIRKIKPDIIFTVDPRLENEMHPVHLQVGQAVSEAFMRSGQIYYPFHENYSHLDAHKVKNIGFYFTNEGNTIADISDVIDMKINAMKAHETQMSEQLIEICRFLNQTTAQKYDFEYGEELKILSSDHTHCFAFPKAIINQIPIQIFK